MDRDNCVACDPCKEIGNYYCDKCTASCCLNNMENHREIYNLGDEFNNIINNIRCDLYNKSCSIQNNLINNCNIHINLHCDSISGNEEFLNNMKNKKNEIENRINFLNTKINGVQNDYDMNIQQLNKNHEEKIKSCDVNFENEKRKYEKNEDNEKELKEKREEKKQLENEKSIINNKNKNDIINSFMNEQESIAEQDFSNKKIQIEQQYLYEKEKLEYTENEVKIKNDYFNEIQKIKLYSDKIPNYFNTIVCFGLNKFIN